MHRHRYVALLACASFLLLAMVGLSAEETSAEAAQRLAKSLPDVQVQIDPNSGIARQITSRKGFLSAPQGGLQAQGQWRSVSTTPPIGVLAHA